MAQQNQSWLELLDSSNSCSNDALKNPKRLSYKQEHDEETQVIDKREQKIKILDISNEKKFDKLFSNKKSPFKRRLSNEERQHSEVQTKVDTPSRQKGKRSKLDTENYKESNKRVKEEVADADEDDNDELEEGEILDESIIKNFNSKKRLRSESSSISSSNGSSSGIRDIETDKATLERRQKQIDYGKNTAGYDSYILKVPKTLRTREHPKTPPKHIKYSRRAWEGLVKCWRKKLHTFDDPQDVKIEVDDNATGF